MITNNGKKRFSPSGRHPELAIKISDFHVHLVDFLQRPASLTEILRTMDQAEVERAVIFGLPVRKLWDAHEPVPPSYYLDGYSRCVPSDGTDWLLLEAFTRLTEKEQSRLYPFICGFVPTDRRCVDHVESMIQSHAGVFCGIGELLLRHDKLSTYSLTETPRVDHPSLGPVYELAAGQGLPVLVHSNIGWSRDSRPSTNMRCSTHSATTVRLNSCGLTQASATTSRLTPVSFRFSSSRHSMTTITSGLT